MEIALKEQELQDNHIESIRIITGGFVINKNRTTNTDTVVTALMDSYHERLQSHTHIYQHQFNESYIDKHMLTTFLPAPSIASTFFEDVWLAAQRRSEKNQRNAYDGNYPVG